MTLKDFIYRCGLNQASLATLTGLARATISGLMNDKRRVHPDTLKKVADILSERSGQLVSVQEVVAMSQVTAERPEDAHRQNGC